MPSDRAKRLIQALWTYHDLAEGWEIADRFLAEEREEAKDFYASKPAPAPWQASTVYLRGGATGNTDTSIKLDFSPADAIEWEDLP